MGRMISQKSATDKILREVEITLAVAEATGPDMAADAQEYLSEVIAQAAEVDRQIAENASLLVRLRAQLQAGNERANDTIQRVRDEFFNLIGRGSRDPILRRIFPQGAGHFTGFKPPEKPIALQLLASALEAHRHRRVPDEDVARLTGLLRDEAAGMEATLAALYPARVEARVLRSQRKGTAQLAHQRLTGLKRFWLAEGLSEAEIHEVIPSRAGKRKASAENDAPEQGAETAQDEQTEETDELDLLEDSDFDADLEAELDEDDVDEDEVDEADVDEADVDEEEVDEDVPAAG